jgi:hypothetical protein
MFPGLGVLKGGSTAHVNLNSRERTFGVLMSHVPQQMPPAVKAFNEHLDTVVTLLSHCCYTVVTQLLYSRESRRIPLYEFNWSSFVKFSSKVLTFWFCKMFATHIILEINANLQALMHTHKLLSVLSPCSIYTISYIKCHIINI